MALYDCTKCASAVALRVQQICKKGVKSNKYKNLDSDYTSDKSVSVSMSALLL